MSELVNVANHYRSGDLSKRVQELVDDIVEKKGTITVTDLSAFDKFHTRGHDSTVELAELASPQKSDTVLDVGCGLAGTARYLVHRFQCHVTALDLTGEFVEVANMLNRSVGAHDQVELVRANALQLPFADESFDLVVTEHAQMNIANKREFFSEIARVLKTGGRFVFHDVFLGTGESISFPVPWADDQSLSALEPPISIRSYLNEFGIQIDDWHDKSAVSIGFFEQVLSKLDSVTPTRSVRHLLMGNTMREKVSNYLVGLRDSRIVVGMARGTKRCEN